MGRGTFEAEKGRPIVKYRDTLLSAVQNTTEPIEIPFEISIRVGPRNHPLVGGPDRPMRRCNF